MAFLKWLDSLILAVMSRFYRPQTPPVSPQEPPTAPQPATPPPMNPDDIVYPWDTPAHCFHNFRVLCDKAGLLLEEKNKLCACVYQESQFHTAAINRNRAADGTILSTDWSLYQINDHYHIGPGKDFPSVEYVLGNPAVCGQWMIKMYKEGLLKQWVSYSSGAYKHWLSPSSPMWALKT